MIVLPAKLEIVSNDGSRKNLEITKDIITFGSHPKCSVRLKSSDVSSEHIQIIRNSDGYFLVKMDARNSVTLNSVPVPNTIKKQLKQNDVIALGKNIKIIFTFGSLSSFGSIKNSTISTKKLSSNLVMGVLAVLALIAVGIIIFPSSKPKIVANSTKDNSVQNANTTDMNTQTFNPVGEENPPSFNSNQANATLQNTNATTKTQSQNTAANISSPTKPDDDFKYEAKMIGIISSISGKDNYVFSNSFKQMVANRLEKYKKSYPAFYDDIQISAQDINREFTNSGLNLKLAYLLSFSRNNGKSSKNIFGVSESILKNGYENENDLKTLAVYTKELLGAFEQDYLKTIGNLGITVSEAGKINAALNKSSGGFLNSKIVDKKDFPTKNWICLQIFCGGNYCQFTKRIWDKNAEDRIIGVDYHE